MCHIANKGKDSISTDFFLFGAVFLYPPVLFWLVKINRLFRVIKFDQGITRISVLY